VAVDDSRPSRPAVACAGLIVADVFVPVLDRVPEPGSIVTVDGFLRDAGGCAANTATTLARLGIATALVATVGADAPGEWLLSDLAAKGVDVRGVASVAAPTSETIILPVAGDDRRYVHVPGANAALAAVDVARGARGAAVLAVGGFLALPALVPVELATVFKEARTAGTRIVLDVVVPDDARDSADAVRTVLPFVDWFVPNDDEARRLTGADDPVDQAAVLLDWGCSAVVITRGKAGALYADEVQALRVHPLLVEVVDGSGAGDAFTAGLIAGLVHGWPVERILRFAAAVGGSATRGLGCTTTVFTDDEARQAMGQVAVTRLPWPAG
jgi:sugar/nucleoside kinase (ribokinase family)